VAGRSHLIFWTSIDSKLINDSMGLGDQLLVLAGHKRFGRVCITHDVIGHISAMSSSFSLIAEDTTQPCRADPPSR